MRTVQIFSPYLETHCYFPKNPFKTHVCSEKKIRKHGQRLSTAYSLKFYSRVTAEHCIDLTSTTLNQLLKLEPHSGLRSKILKMLLPPRTILSSQSTWISPYSIKRRISLLDTS